jgi:hypothetical protein
MLSDFSVDLNAACRKLNNNQLSSFLPTTIEYMTKVQYLYVTALSGIVASSVIEKLLFSDISNNGISGTIPNQIGALSNIQYLFVFSLN